MSVVPASAADVWLLCDDRPGNVTQALGLAEALGLPFVNRRLAFRRCAGWQVPVTSALWSGAFGWPTRIGLDSANSDPLMPPWPRLILAAGGRCAPIARWIRARSNGATTVIVLGRKAALCTTGVDLAIAPRTARLPLDPRRIETDAPLHRLRRSALDRAAASHAPFAGAPRPRIALIVGGSAGRHRFGAADAIELAEHSLALARRSGGSLFVTTSRRTGDEATEALVRRLGRDPCLRELHRFRAAGDDNPYAALLGGADVLIVTEESESMLAEAASTGRPVLLAPLPIRAPGRRRRFRDAFALAVARNEAGQGRLRDRFAQALVTNGLVLPPRDLSRLHDALISRGIARRFSTASEATAGERVSPLDEAASVAAEVRKRLGNRIPPARDGHEAARG